MLFRVVAFKAAVFIFFFLLGGGVLVFIWKKTEPGFLQGWQGCSLEPAVLLWSMCLSVARGFLRGSSSWGVCRWDSCYHAGPRDLKQCELAVFACLNAKQRGVGSSVDSAAAGLPRWKRPAPHHLTADQAGMLSRVEGSGLCSWVNLNKPSFELLYHPSRGVRMVLGGVGGWGWGWVDHG